MLDPSIRKFAEATGNHAARVLIPSEHEDDVAERERLAFRLAVAFAYAMQAEEKLRHRSSVTTPQILEAWTKRMNESAA